MPKIRHVRYNNIRCTVLRISYQNFTANKNTAADKTGQILWDVALTCIMNASEINDNEWIVLCGGGVTEIRRQI